MQERIFDESCLSADARRCSPAEQRETLRLLNDLDPALKRIVAEEIKLGNRVGDAGADYPQPGSIHVAMTHVFDGRYANAHVEFRRGEGLHDWRADYSILSTPTHLLVC